jgi:hypothetical protein
VDIQRTTSTTRKSEDIIAKRGATKIKITHKTKITRTRKRDVLKRFLSMGHWRSRRSTKTQVDEDVEISSKRIKTDAMYVDCRRVKQQMQTHHIEAIIAVPQEEAKTWKESEIE